jgi:DUF4097 and DUF4098 domain-containing protein YvlB
MLVSIAALALPATAPAQIDTTFAVTPGGRISLELRSGALRLGSWDRQAIRLRSTGAARSTAGVAIRSTAAEVTVSASGAAGGNAQWELLLPRPYGVRVEGTQLQVLAEGIDGDIHIEVVAGNAEVRGGTGNVTVETLQGSIDVLNRTGTLRLNATNLGVQVVDSRGEVDARSINGTIRLQRVVGARVRASAVNGNIVFEGDLSGRGEYTFGTHNGSISLRLGDSPDASFQALSRSGSIETDFPIQLTRGRNGAFEFTLGSGSASVRVETFNGGIELRRARQGDGARFR